MPIRWWFMMICDATGWGGPVIVDYCDLCKSYMIMTQKTPYGVGGPWEIDLQVKKS